MVQAARRRTTRRAHDHGARRSPAWRRFPPTRSSARLHGPLRHPRRPAPRRRRAGGACSSRIPAHASIWDANVHAVEPGAVDAGAVTVRAPLDRSSARALTTLTLPAELRPTRTGLTRCRLQMLQGVARPAVAATGRHSLTGLSLLRYPAFTAQPGVRTRARAARGRAPGARRGWDPPDRRAAVRRRADRRRHPRLRRHGLAVSARSGSTGSCSPRRSGCSASSALEVRERWHGVYPTRSRTIRSWSSTPLAGVRVVEVISGVGMTAALGLAAARARAADRRRRQGRRRAQRRCRRLTAAPLRTLRKRVLRLWIVISNASAR